MTQHTLTPDAEYTLIRRALRGDAPVSDADKRRYEAVRNVFDYELTSKQMIDVTRRYSMGMKLREIAAARKVAVRAVSYTLKHAREKFVRALEMAG